MEGRGIQRWLEGNYQQKGPRHREAHRSRHPEGLPRLERQAMTRLVQARREELIQKVVQREERALGQRASRLPRGRGQVEQPGELLLQWQHTATATQTTAYWAQLTQSSDALSLRTSLRHRPAPPSLPRPKICPSAHRPPHQRQQRARERSATCCHRCQVTMSLVMSSKTLMQRRQWCTH